MIKKIATALMVFAAWGCTLASAMFFDDNPRYIQVGHNETTESYLDTSSISSIRYDPPYYIIRCTGVTYDFSRNLAIGYENNFFYNFTAQTVKTQTLSTTMYDGKGNPSSQSINPAPEVADTDRYSVNGKAADKAFFNCYSMTFYHSFDSKKSSTKGSGVNG